jgi:hypothetical protein
MTGIQPKNIYISKSVHFIDVQFAPLRRKTQTSFLFPDLVYLSGGTTNIQTILDLCVCCSDEVSFLVSGAVILHNFRIWGNKNPHTMCDLERDSVELNVLCMAGSSDSFFLNQPMTLDLYMDMLELCTVLQLPCETLVQ